MTVNALMAHRGNRVGAEEAAGRQVVTALALTSSDGGIDDNACAARHVVTSLHLQQDPIWLHDLSLPLERASGTTPIAVLHGAVARRLSPLESERLMGLPDGWTAPPGLSGCSNSRRYQALGDACVVTVAEWLGRRLVAVDGWAGR